MNAKIGKCGCHEQKTKVNKILGDSKQIGLYNLDQRNHILLHA